MRPMKINAMLRLLAASVLATSVGCNSTEPRLLNAAPSSASPQTLQTSIERDLTYLASDELEGRGVGTRGLDLASHYIADRFRSLGLRALPGSPDYFQHFTMNAAAAVHPSTKLLVGDTALERPAKYSIPGFSADGDFSAPVVFAGYGISNSKRNYDDYAGIDVKGKIVLVLRYEPHNEKGTSRWEEGDWSPDASLATKAEAAAAHGAAALLLVNPTKFHGPDRLVPVSRGGPKSEIPFVHIKQEVAEDLLKRGGSTKNLETLQSEIDASATPQSFELKDVMVSGRAEIQREKVPVRNVLAYLPGGSRPDEYIVVGAHYDHLGLGGAGSRMRGASEIHNGADDNASGTAAVMSLAEQLARLGRRDRSVLFILFTGEETGLIGSEYFVDHPPMKLDQIIAMLNLDMVGRIRNKTLYMGGTGTAEAFDTIIQAADAKSPLLIKPTGRGGRGPSDHQSFAMKQIPVLFFFSGMHPEYHTPADDVDKINQEGIAQVVDLASQIVDMLSVAPRQQYVAKFDAERTSLSSSSGGRPRVTLGVVPDYGSDESVAGVRISGTTPGSPAAGAGLRDGDIISQMNDKKIQNLYDLTDFLARAKAGDEVRMVLERDKQRIETTVTLAERKD